jgi:hypothetical protein
MKERVISHKYLHLLILVIILGFSLFTFTILGGKRDLQFLVGFMSAISYVMWGIIYHVIERDLYPRVVLEYVLVAAIGMVLLYTVLFA